MTRIAELRKILLRKKLDALLVTGSANRNYLSGFTGSTAFLVVSLKSALFVTDSRYIEQAGKEISPEFELAQVKSAKEYNGAIADLVKKDKVRVMAVEAGNLVVSQFETLKKYLPKKELRPQTGLVEGLREIKTKEELEKIRKAVDIAEKAFQITVKRIRPGISENEVAAELEYNMRLLGSERAAFPTIVASGKRGALPHGVATDKKLNKGELIVLDFGAVYKGYCSDLTRTIGLGIIVRQFKNHYKMVYEAQQKAISSISSGVLLSFPDKKARNYLKKHRLAEFFTHGLGHGLGMEVHERPSINNVAKGFFQAGMVVTVEPGVYLKGQYGIRIENDIIVKEKGCEVLGKGQQKLVIL